MAKMNLTIVNRTAPLVEAVAARGEEFCAQLHNDWKPFHDAGIDMCCVRSDGDRLIAEPSEEFTKFCAERGVSV